METRISRMRAHYHMILADKNRWLKTSVAINIIFVVFLMLMLALDASNPGIGWIQ